MTTDELKRIVDNKNHIAGIYNYCDRWCERCAFTKRCANFSIGEFLEIDSETFDLENDRFWNTIRESFELTFALLQEAVEELEIDFTEVDPEIVEAEERSNDQVRRSPIGISTMAYIRLVDRWFQEAGTRFHQKGDELSRIALVEVERMDVEEDLSDLKDCVDVIRWYQMQIHVKIMRAMHGREDEVVEDRPGDSDGSAKVALIGVDRSIGAWARMWKRHFPEEEDVILPVLSHLERVRRQIDSEFPNARSFIRPGLDE